MPASDPPAPPPSLLSARGITKRFGGFTALDGVDFAVRGGEIHALLGENGAGKSTLMNLLSGLLRPTDGEIRVDGQPVRFGSPEDAARAGVGMVHQHFLLVPPLSVRENLLLGASADKGGPLSYPLRSVVAEARAIADRLGWRIPWDAPAGDLPVGTQQRIEILKALRGTTRVLIFDEPTAVLTPTETPELFATIRALAGEGRGIVFISHKLPEVLALAHEVTVLRRGRVVHRTRAGGTDAPRLAEAMVGGALTPGPGEPSPPAPLPLPPLRGGRGVPVTVSAAGPREGNPEGTGTPAASAPRAAEVGLAPGTPLPPAKAGSRGEPGTRGAGGGVRVADTGPMLHVTHLTLGAAGNSGRARLQDVTFSVAPGEVFGIAGVDGNGQAELAECLAGLLRPDAGQIRVGGEQPAPNTAAFRKAGVAVIPADRQRRGLALTLTLTENLALGVHDTPAYRRGPLLLWPRLRTRAGDLIRQYDVRAEGPGVPARALSGGNQQKVVIARALSQNPRVVVAVNPTRGLDIGATAYVHESLLRARDDGAAIVLISTELDEVLSLATERVGVLYEGTFSGITTTAATREELGLLMGGGRKVAA